MAGWPGTSTKVKFVLAAGHDPPSNHRRSDNDNSSNCSSQYRLSLDTVRNSPACKLHGGALQPLLSDFLGAFNIEVTYVRSLISEETADKIPYTVYDMLQETEKETFLKSLRDHFVPPHHA